MESNKRDKTREIIVAVTSVILGVIITSVAQLFLNIPKLELNLKDVIIILLFLLLASLSFYTLRRVEKSLFVFEKDLQNSFILSTQNMQKLVFDSENKIRSLISRMEDFDYAQDFEATWQNGTYEGNVFKKLNEYVDGAQSHIYAISLSSIADHNFLPQALKDRMTYYDRIADVVEKYHNEGKEFKYRRIFQVANEQDKVADFMYTHRDRVEKYNNGKLQARVRYIAIRRMTGLVIIDGKILIFVISGITNNTKSPYPVALLIFKDSFEDLIQAYTEYFESLFGDARNLP